MANENLLHVTFTGPDEGTDMSALVDLQREFGRRVEIGILVDPEKTGEPRYPRREWIRKFLKVSQPNAQSSLHLCGEAVRMFLGENRDYMDLAVCFDTVQLWPRADQCSIQAQEVIRVAQVFNQLCSIRPNGCGVVVVPHALGSRSDVINTIDKKQQEHLAGERILPYILQEESMPDFPIAAFSPSPKGDVKFFYDQVTCCGFGGGLNSRNVSAENAIINDRAKGDNYWLQIHQGVRTFRGPDDKVGFFDVGKCREVMRELGF